jgi:hypothetical protein
VLAWVGRELRYPVLGKPNILIAVPTASALCAFGLRSNRHDEIIIVSAGNVLERFGLGRVELPVRF